MTSIVVARRDGILRAPDGTQYRTRRGQTLADAAHPAVLASPHDWSPITIELSLPDSDVSRETLPPGGIDRINQLENDLAEVEEMADHRGVELQRLADGLRERGITLPAEDAREQGWLVDLVLDALPGPAVKPPRLPRAAKAAP